MLCPNCHTKLEREDHVVSSYSRGPWSKRPVEDRGPFANYWCEDCGYEATWAHRGFVVRFDPTDREQLPIPEARPEVSPEAAPGRRGLLGRLQRKGRPESPGEDKQSNPPGRGRDRSGLPGSPPVGVPPCGA